ncbi:MAG: 4-hydroxy-tetrahydrodipicolinate synthase [Pseudomonadota bacterium]
MKDDNFLAGSLGGSIVALVTPMHADGSVDLDTWCSLIDWHLDSGTDGLVVAGTTGESATLAQDDYDSLLSAAVERVNGRIAVLAGTGSASTANVIRDSRRAARLGADAVLVVAPYYNRPPQRGLIAHYRAVAEASAVPVVLYNVPSRTVTDLLPETAIVLAEHENIIAIKEGVPDPARLQQLIEAGVPVLSGDDPSALMAMRMGAKGVISVIANIAPVQTSAVCRAALAGDYENAERITAALEPIIGFLNIETNPIPVKWMLAELGRIKPYLRLPLVELSAEHHEAGHKVLQVLSGIEA